MYFPDLGVVTPSVGAAHEFTMYKSQRESYIHSFYRVLLLEDARLSVSLLYVAGSAAGPHPHGIHRAPNAMRARPDPFQDPFIGSIAQISIK